MSEGHADAALTLLKAGAESHKRDADDFLAIDLAPDNKVRMQCKAGEADSDLSSDTQVHPPGSRTRGHRGDDAITEMRLDQRICIVALLSYLTAFSSVDR